MMSSSLGDPRLRVRSAEVPDQALEGQALQDLVKDLIETMRARNGQGSLRRKSEWRSGSA